MRPPYRELCRRAGYPDRSSWGLWGLDDQTGGLNDVTPDQVADAARLVTTGTVLPLSWSMHLPEPALFERGPLVHTINDDGYGLDDRYDGSWPQRSSRWDALSHFRHPHHGFYGGRTALQLQGPQALNGIDNWAGRGIAARFVLADLTRWRAASGRPLHLGDGEAVPISEVVAALDAQGVDPRPGDILILRFGWIDWYRTLNTDERRALAGPGPAWTATGLHPDLPGGTGSPANALALM